MKNELSTKEKHQYASKSTPAYPQTTATIQDTTTRNDSRAGNSSSLTAVV